MLIFLYLIALLACFIFLARIVDLFFISSLDRISHDLRLTNDAAGATLMAAGSSAPELFVALFAVLRPGGHQVIGIGSIVGSALFNLLVIVGIVAMIKNSKLTWQPMIRDLIFYLVAVSLLIWGITDNRFSISEALVFIIVYLVYILAVAFWKRILPYRDEKSNSIETYPKKKPVGFIRIFDKLTGYLFPPDKYYSLIFFISIVLIAGVSWALVELAIKISVILNIPESVIALTVIAAGTSVPDLFASVIVAKQGRGDMAVSNAIGSNIFDILMGLGFPFLISMSIYGTGIEVSTENLLYSSVILLASVLLLLAMLVGSRWRVNKVSGVVLLGLYLFYVVHEIIKLYLT